jgi:lipoprotein-anchoring transpeptidase ErfK/SrfK
MRLSGPIRFPNYAYALFLAPFIVCAMAAPAGAEPSLTPPNTAATSTGAANAPSGSEAKPNAATAPQDSTATTGANKPGESAAKPQQPQPSAAAGQPKPSGPGQSGAKPETGTAATAEPAKQGSKIHIAIDKSRQHMTVFVDGIEKYDWPVSTGMYGYSTPSGNYAPTSMNEIWYSKEWDNAPMPHAIFYMKDGHAIHGSQEVKRLGTPASHGCVRLSPKNANTLYTLVKANGMDNTTVVIEGLTPGGEAKVAAKPQNNRRYEDADAAPWMAPDNYPRGLFGWQRGPGWGQGYAPPPRYRERRGWFQRPRNYYYGAR